MTLKLRMADSFMLRLLGLHAHGGVLREDEGLLLNPCRMVHTLFLTQAIDLVFLDGRGRVCLCVHALPPRRVAAAARARMVVELPAGYCRRHPDYLYRIRAALRAGD